MRRRSPWILFFAGLAILYILAAPLKQCADRWSGLKPLNAHDGEITLLFFTLAATSAWWAARKLSRSRNRVWPRTFVPRGYECLMPWLVLRRISDNSPPSLLLRV